MGLGVKPVRGTGVRTVTKIGTQQELQTLLQIWYRSGAPADVLASSLRESLSCIAETVSELVTMDLVGFPRKKCQ